MNLCVIGTSKITQQHLKVLKFFFKIICISSTRKNSKNLNKISKKFGIKKKFNDWKKAVKYSSSFKDTAFFITSRVKDNKKILLSCCRTGKKIFIEKPVFENPKEFKKFIKYKNQIFVGYNRIFYKNINYLKKNIINKKDLNILIKCPENTKKDIILNSCHIISVLLYIFKKILIIKTVRRQNYINSYLKIGKKFNTNLVFNIKNSDNFLIEIYDKKIRYVLSPIEDLKIYKNIIKKIDKKNNVKYIPVISKKINEYSLDNYKPGFMNQAKKFYGFCKGASIVNDIKFALKIVNICKKIIK